MGRSLHHLDPANVGDGLVPSRVESPCNSAETGDHKGRPYTPVSIGNDSSRTHSDMEPS